MKQFIIHHASNKNDDLSRWISQLKARKHACCTVVATAHKLARLMWVLLHKQAMYQPQYRGAQELVSC